MTVTTLFWFRRDLRLADQPALSAAVRAEEAIIPIYIHDPELGEDWSTGSASRWWLHHSLVALDSDLQRLGSGLVIRVGAAQDVINALVDETGAERVIWNRLYEPAAIRRDTAIKATLKARGIQVDSRNGSLLYEPWEITRPGGEPYRVFTPFWKALQQRGLDSMPEAAPTIFPKLSRPLGVTVDDLGLLPKIPWDQGFYECWRPGEAGAHLRLDEFVEDAIGRYRDERDRPDRAGTSRLAPHLHFGEIGPRQIVAGIRVAVASEVLTGAAEQIDCYIRELAWREFAHHLLFHFPATTDQPLDTRFEAFPWAEPEPDLLRAWQRGQTGIPLVDAGMRELWKTGWMHNRVRMVVASFLTKNLRLHWLHGARWFWDTLVDADLANNTLGWQWTAGCGADAAPYFRVFNPILQGERFDPDGLYVRRWVPELAKLPNSWLHHPWDAPEPVLAAAGVRLGSSYPRALVDLRASREAALEAFASIKKDA